MKGIRCPKGHGAMKYQKIHKSVNFRGVDVPFETKVYVCSVCRLEAADVESAGATQRAIADAYRQKKNLLTGKQIRDFRKKKGLTQQDLADLTRVGIASIKRWETGLIQSEAMDHILRTCFQRQNTTDIYSGKREFSIERIKLVIRTFEKKLGKRLLKKRDKMLFAAKYLWYADMLAFRYLGQSMTGASYASLPYGPQLNNYRDLVDEIGGADESRAERLTPGELNIINKICERFPKERLVYDAAHREAVVSKRRIGAIIPYSDSANLTEIE